MNIDMIIYLARHTMETAMLVAAPVLLACMIAGVGISLFQTITSIRDMTLTMAPKLVAAGLALLLFGNWMLQVLIRFTTEIFNQIQSYGQ